MTKQNKNKKIWVELANGKRTSNVFMIAFMLPYLVVRSFWEERAVIREHLAESKKGK